MFCSSFIRSLLPNCIFFLVCLQKINVCCTIHFQLKKKRSIRFSDCHFTNKFASLVLSFFLSGKGFVSKLDELIHWLNEAMETTENWTPPKAETDSLKLYLETHLVGQDYTMIVISNWSVLWCFLFDYYFLIISVHLYFNVRSAALQFVLMNIPTNYLYI